MNKFTLILVYVTLLIGLFLGCDKKNNPSTTAPLLPPPGSMSIDFSNFIPPTKGGITQGEIKGLSASDKSTWHNGHIKANHYFQDSNWHCWNEVGDNVTCN